MKSSKQGRRGAILEEEHSGGSKGSQSILEISVFTKKKSLVSAQVSSTLASSSVMFLRWMILLEEMETTAVHRGAPHRK